MSGCKEVCNTVFLRFGGDTGDEVAPDNHSLGINVDCAFVPRPK